MTTPTSSSSTRQQQHHCAELPPTTLAQPRQKRPAVMAAFSTACALVLAIGAAVWQSGHEAMRTKQPTGAAETNVAEHPAGSPASVRRTFILPTVYLVDSASAAQSVQVLLDNATGWAKANNDELTPTALFAVVRSGEGALRVQQLVNADASVRGFLGLPEPQVVDLRGLAIAER